MRHAPVFLLAPCGRFPLRGGELLGLLGCETWFHREYMVGCVMQPSLLPLKMNFPGRIPRLNSIARAHVKRNADRTDAARPSAEPLPPLLPKMSEPGIG